MRQRWQKDCLAWRFRLRIFVLTGLLYAGTGMAPGQTGAPAPQPGSPQLAPAPAVLTPPLQRRDQVTTLQARARAVLLDIVVTDGKGHAVEGLKQSEFQVYEDGKPQAIASFEEHHGPPADLATAAPLPPNTYTNAHPAVAADSSMVVLLDALDTPISAQQYVREQMISFLQSMKPGIPVAIFQLDTRMHLIQGFTSDPKVLLNAVKNRDSAKLTAVPRDFNYVSQAIQMDYLNAGMQVLSTYMQQYPGRKNLAWFTGRIPGSVYGDGLGGGTLRDPEQFQLDYTKLTDTLQLGRVTVYPIDSRGLQSDPAFSAAHNGVPSIHSAQNFSTRQFYEHSDLDDIADATGGRAFYNTNSMKQALGEIVDTGTHFYTVSYYPTNKDWTGEYRKLKVTTATSGLRLEYRPGYYALRDAGGTREGSRARVQLTHNLEDTQFHNAMQLGAVDPGSIVFQAHVVTDPEIRRLAKGDPLPKDFGLDPKLRDKPYRNCNMVFRVEGGQIHLTAKPGGLHAGSVDFVALAYDDQGSLISKASISVDMTLKQDTYDRILQSGFEMPLSIAVPAKGQYFLRMGIHDVTGGQGGVVEVAVGDLAAVPAP